MVCSQSNQKPALKRPPERSSLSIGAPPKSTTGPGFPRMPAEPGGLAVTSGGTLVSLIHQSKYSPRTQNRPSGPQGSVQGAHGGCPQEATSPSIWMPSDVQGANAGRLGVGAVSGCGGAPARGAGREAPADGLIP